MKPRKTLHISILTVLIMFITVLPGLCRGEKQQVSEENIAYTNPEKTVQCRVGEAFSIILDSNPTTGYQWQLVNSPDGGFLKLIGSEYRAPKTGLAGAGGKEIWSFKALSAGQTMIVFEYLRPWERNKEPVKRTVFTVNTQ